MHCRFVAATDLSHYIGTICSIAKRPLKRIGRCILFSFSHKRQSQTFKRNTVEKDAVFNFFDAFVDSNVSKMVAVIKSIGFQSFIAGIAAGYGDILQRFRQDCAALFIVLRTEGIADGVRFAVGAVAGKGNRELYKTRAVFQRTELNLVNKVGNHKLGHGGILNACDLHSAVAVGRVIKGSKVGFVK